MVTSAGRSDLRRSLSRWDLAAIGVNQVIGAAVFAQPAILAAHVGAWSPWMIVAVGGASMLVALSFAEVASRFDQTGGSYLYTRAAFGRFTAFEVGWLMWFTRAVSWAAVLNVLADSLGYYWPASTAGTTRVLLITGLIGTITFINIRGIRSSSTVINALTVGKLLPLVVFILAGMFAVDTTRLQPETTPTAESISATGLLLVYAFGGYEVVPVVAGESRDPRRMVPFGLITTIAIATLVMALAQLVALGTLPTLAASSSPLADSARVFLGPGGGALLTLAVFVSVAGASMGNSLSGSRTVFALAEQGDLPAVFAYVHPAFRTPATAILLTAAVTLALALSGGFAALAAVSGVSRLIVYVLTCAATLRLRRREFTTTVPAPKFVLPFGPAIPMLSIVFAFSVLAGATFVQLSAGAYALSAGALLYVLARWPAKR